jgi:hypothetical protein
MRSLRRIRVPGASQVTRPTRNRCAVCGQFAKTLTPGRRCEPCAGVLPLEWPSRPLTGEPAEESAAVCAELGEHDRTSTQPCDCGQDHALPVCARCLVVDDAECAAPGGGELR